MKAVVAARAFRFLVPKVKRVLHGHAAILCRKVQHGRRAAKHRRTRAGDEVVRGHRDAQIEIEVRVRVDKTREYEFSARVDNFVRLLVDSCCNPLDESVLDQDIRLFDALAAYERSILYEGSHG